MDTPLCCLWQPCEGGARLVRLLGETPCPVLPRDLAGRPLLEIGAYCFAPALRAEPGPVYAAMGGAAYKFSSAAQAIAAFSLPQIAGSFPASITLPESVQLIDNAAFYNCRSLQNIAFGKALRRVGSDCFTNCFALQTLTVHALPGESTGLSKVLARISAAVCAVFAKDETKARLFFPEYSDDHPENGPAHIFMHEFQGAGYLFRQCFSLSGEVHFAEYDGCFARALDLEMPEVLCRIALGRLLFPVSLGESARAAYRAACQKYGEALAALLLAENDLNLLEFACREALLTPESLQKAAALAAGQNKPQAAALFMRYLLPEKPNPKSYDF